MAQLNPSKQKYQVDYDDGSGPLGFIQWSLGEFSFKNDKGYATGFNDMKDIVKIIQKLNRNLQEKA